MGVAKVRRRDVCDLREGAEAVSDMAQAEGVIPARPPYGAAQITATTAS